MERVPEISGWINDPERFCHAIISGRRKSFKPANTRIDIRPVLIKGERMLQVVSHDGQRDTTKNYPNIDLAPILAEGYANLRIELVDEAIEIRISKRGEFFFHRTSSARSELALDHDRKKDRMLPANDPIFQALGISDASGQIIPRRNDKYLQVDRFLRVIAGVLEDLRDETELSVVDLGCGSAYLTFATERYLRLAGFKPRVTGIDIRSDSRSRNLKVAKQIGSQCEFLAAEIADQPPQKTSIAIALHACDTATDDALAWAVRSNASVILAAPCCHHEVNKNLNSPRGEWEPLLRSGIMKERFADLLTDALRAQILRLLGYRVDVIEFISDEHTPRNLMIRAIRTGTEPDAREIEALLSLAELWQIKPRLVLLLADLMPKQISARLG